MPRETTPTGWPEGPWGRPEVQRPCMTRAPLTMNFGEPWDDTARVARDLRDGYLKLGAPWSLEIGSKGRLLLKTRQPDGTVKIKDISPR